MSPAKRVAIVPLAIIATILLLVGLAAEAMMPARALAKGGYNLYLAGTQITDDSPKDVFGDGTVLYDASSGTLTLENYVATGEDSGQVGAMLYASDIDLTLVLKGENALVGGNGGGISVSGLTITGDGTLAVSSGNCPSYYTTAGISAYTLTIDESFTGTLIATGGRALDGSYGIECTTLTINGGTVIATGGMAKASAGVCVNESSTISGGILYAQGGNATESYSAGFYGDGSPQPTVSIDGGVLVARAGLANSALGSTNRRAFQDIDCVHGDGVKIAGFMTYSGDSLAYGGTFANSVSAVIVPASWTETTGSELPAQLTGDVYCLTPVTYYEPTTSLTELDTSGYTALFVNLYEDLGSTLVGLSFDTATTVSGGGAVFGIGGIGSNSYGLRFRSSFEVEGAKVFGASAAGGNVYGVAADSYGTVTDGTVIGVGGTSYQVSTGVSFCSSGYTTIDGASEVAGVGGTAGNASMGILWPEYSKFKLEGSANMLAAGGLSLTSNSYGVGRTSQAYIPDFDAGTRLAALGGCAPNATSMGISTSTLYSGGKHYCEEGCTIVALGGVGAYSYGDSAYFYEITLYGDMTVAGRTRAFKRNGDTYENAIWVGSDCTFTGYADYAGAGEGVAIADGCKFSDLVGYKRIVLKPLVTYPLSIAGTQVTGDNIDDLASFAGVTVGSGGSLTFDPDTNTLHLNGVTIATPDFAETNGYGKQMGIYYGGSDILNIVVDGKNSVTAPDIPVGSIGLGGIDSYGIDAYMVKIVLNEGAELSVSGGDVPSGQSYGIYISQRGAITGPGTLRASGGKASSSSYGIYAYGSLKITNLVDEPVNGMVVIDPDDPALTAPGPVVEAVGGKSESSYGIKQYLDGGYLTIYGSTVNATAAGSNWSYGIDAGARMGIGVSEVYASGGTAGTYCYGMYDDSYQLNINNSKVTAIGGTVPVNFTPTLYFDDPDVVAGGSVNADGTGAVLYDAADQETYKWYQVPFTRTVSFAAGGGSGSMKSVEVSYGATYTLPKCTFTAPKCKAFASWDKGAVGAKITVTSDMTVTAKWKDAHKLAKVAAVAATCEKTGNIEHWKCSVCGTLFGDSAGKKQIAQKDTVVAATGHKWGAWKTVKAATTEAEGLERRTCANDSSHVEERAIPKLEPEPTPAPTETDVAKAAIASVPKQGHTGNPLKPALEVTLGGKTLQAGVDYDVAYANNVSPGTATATITGKGAFKGTQTVTFEIAKAAPTKWERKAGEEALDTMADIVEAGWSGETGGVVVLATDAGYWDALTAAGIAGFYGAPVLMTAPDRLSPQTEKLLQAMKPKTILICGGPNVVHESTANAAKAAAGGAAVDRYWGQTMTDTADDVFLKAAKAAGGTWSGTAFVATSNGYWDALAAAPVSYTQHMPIFLTESREALSANTIKAMQAGGVEKVVIVGGTAVVAKSVDAQLEAAGIEVAGRLWGETAIDTSVKVAEYGLKCNMTADNLGVATQNGYWDALAGAALCGKKNSVLVLVDQVGDSPSIQEFAGKYADLIAGGYVFGGRFAVSPEVLGALEKATAGPGMKASDEEVEAEAPAVAMLTL